jgi:hypothetical protein
MNELESIAQEVIAYFRAGHDENTISRRLDIPVNLLPFFRDYYKPMKWVLEDHKQEITQLWNDTKDIKELVKAFPMNKFDLLCFLADNGITTNTVHDHRAAIKHEFDNKVPIKTLAATYGSNWTEIKRILAT